MYMNETPFQKGVLFQDTEYCAHIVLVDVSKLLVVVLLSILIPNYVSYIRYIRYIHIQGEH